MVEVQFISKLLASKSMSVVRQNQITPDHFTAHKEEFMFIQEHYQKYGSVPDVATFLSTYTDFDYLDVSESDKYLVEKLSEQYTCSKMLPVLYKVRDLIEEKQADKAYEYARQEFANLGVMSGFRPGCDIIKNSDDRLKEFKKRKELKGLLGISTGIKELDDITHGWLPGEEFVAIVGRTNEGKSWVQQFFLVQAWLAGNPVLLYSGEMSELVSGFRFDTLHAHFKNEGLMNGGELLGTPDMPLTARDYETYIQNLSTNDVPFIVVTPKHLGRRLTIPDLENLIELYNPKIIGIDQLSLMDDYRAQRGDQPRTKFTHVAEDLFGTSEKYGIPILAPVQASREAAKEAKKNQDAAPEVDQIQESDGVGQNASRVISIKQMPGVLKLAIKKNRYGRNNIEVLMVWDIDTGTMRPFMTAKTDSSGKGEGEFVGTEGEDLF